MSKSENVHVLPGVFNQKVEGPPSPAETSLKTAMEMPIQDIAIVGRKIDGTIVILGSAPDCDTTIGLLYRGATFLAERQQVSSK